MPDKSLEWIVEEAELAFWEVVADHCPEIKTGDYGPDAVRNDQLMDRERIARWYAGNLPTGRLNAGARVQFKRDVVRYPHAVAREGEFGIVTGELQDGVFAVQLELYKPALKDWDNCIHWGGEDILELLDDIEPI